MSKADSLFDWWRELPRSLRPNPFSYSERDEVELAQFQTTLRGKLEGLQPTLEKPFGKAREQLRKDLKATYSRVADALDAAKDRFSKGPLEGDYYGSNGTVRLTWRPVLPGILSWLDDLRTSMLEARKQPLERPFLSLVGADPECLDVPDFHPVCGLWSDNYFIGRYPWESLKWNAVLDGTLAKDELVSPHKLAGSTAHSVWHEVLEGLTGCVRQGHKAVKDSPWTVPHVLCELAKPDSGGESPDTAHEINDRISWATALHVPFRRWLHVEASKRGIDSPLAKTDCYPTWLAFAGIVGDDPTGMIGGTCGYRRACFFAFLLDELTALWDQATATDKTEREYDKPWHGEAFAFLERNPDASAADVGRAVGIDRSTVSRDKMMKKLFAKRQELRRGFTDNDGNVDGIVDPDSLDD